MNKDSGTACSGPSDSNFCYQRIYYSWMTIVVGVVDGLAILAIGAHLASSVMQAGFFTAAQ